MVFSPISSQDRVDFAKNLAVMLKSGLVIDEALGSLSDQARSKAFARLLTKIKNDVEYGTPLSAAFAKEEAVFGRIFVSLIQAGESSGTLEENLSFVADWLERQHGLSQEIKAATFYPKFVIAVMFLLGGVLAVYVLPKLVPLFQQLEVELPWSTKLMIDVAAFAQQFWLATILLGLLAVILLYTATKIGPLRLAINWLSLRLPIIGRLVRDYQLAIVTQLLATLIRGGLPLGEVLTMAAASVSSFEYRRSLEAAKARVLRGVKLSEALSGYKRLYPKSLLNIIATGERSGTLDNSLTYLAEFYGKEVSGQAKKLPTLIEPILLVLIAGGVLFVALSVLMPIYSLTQGIGR